MMKGMFKRALGVVAAAAMAVTGMAALSGTANAAADDITLGTQIQFKVSDSGQFNGRDLEYIKIAGLTAHNTAATDPERELSYLEVITETGIYDKVVVALENKTFTGASDTQFDAGADGDPMAWVMNNLTEDTSTEVAYDGNLRTFASDLAARLSEQTWTPIDWDNTDGSANAIMSEDGKTLTVNGLEPGIYLVRDNNTNATQGVTGKDGKTPSTEPSIVMLVSTGVDVNEDSATLAPGLKDMGGVVDLKNRVTTVDKSVDGSAVSVGGEKTYTITADVPNWTDRKAPFSFKFKDTPTVGQTVLFNTIQVTIINPKDQNQVIVPNFYQVTMLTKPEAMTNLDANEWDATYIGTGQKDAKNSFTVDLTDWMQNNYQEYCDRGYKVQLTYNVRINNNAMLNEDTPVYNDVTVDNNGSTASDSTQDTPIAKPVDVVFTKVQGDNKSPLAGAKFKVQMRQKDGDFVDMHRDATTGVWSIANEENPATEFKSVEVTGTVTIPGLGQGVYNIVETKAPTDYWKILPSFQITINANGAITWDAVTGDVTWNLVTEVKDQSGKTVSVMVKNVNQLTQLPTTGAAGIAAFIVLGLLIAGAGVTVYMKSRNVRNAMRA